jgi:endonuclease/exonuclease/phosphatase family metal-dependent hydrolase
MKLRLATFNLYQYVSPPNFWYDKQSYYRPKEWVKKQQWIDEQILRLEAHVIAFQEVFSIEALQEQVMALGYTHFITVDQPKIDEESIYFGSVVALASKLPFKEYDALQSEAFSFSRKPIRAVIEVANQEVMIYAVHLKSKMQSLAEPRFGERDTVEYKLRAANEAIASGMAENLQQRLLEANYLYDYIHKENKAAILLGDMNDEQHSITLESLQNRAGKMVVLEDSFGLSIDPDSPKKERRIPTNYYKNRGIVLDYILLSSELVQHLKQQPKHEVFNRHLMQNRDDILKSDHAQVVCEVLIKS